MSLNCCEHQTKERRTFCKLEPVIWVQRAVGDEDPSGPNTYVCKRVSLDASRMDAWHYCRAFVQNKS